MPSSHKEKSLLVADAQIKHNGQRKRQVVRYRRYPYRPTSKAEADVNSFIEATNFDQQFDFDDGECELDIDIDDEMGIMGFEEGEPIETPRKMLRMRNFWEASWESRNYELLPAWLQENKFLRTGHRPPIPSFASCFKSIFSLHTETGNIWTHMYGAIAFIGVSAWFLTRSEAVIPLADKCIFGMFFFGAILCLGLSCVFHTVSCHSPRVERFFLKTTPMVIYISIYVILGIAMMIVTFWEQFEVPKFRLLRAGIFMAMGLSGVIPVMHVFYAEGWLYMVDEEYYRWLLLMSFLYLAGGTIYAIRFPERYFPGHFDIWFHSHTLFHMFVVVAAFVHFYGITGMAMERLEGASCSETIPLNS